MYAMLEKYPFARSLENSEGVSKARLGVGGSNHKTFCSRGMDISWNNTLLLQHSNQSFL